MFLYSISIFITFVFPICILRSFAPLPYISTILSLRLTSEGDRLHSSDIRIPVENKSSATAISRRAFFRLYGVVAEAY